MDVVDVSVTVVGASVGPGGTIVVVVVEVVDATQALHVPGHFS